uniref:Dynamin N-terminal domain-containing protein n=1 Tax=candidate division CPR3 bacterium TaxID=2268181 RepID=A0A7V3J9A0_UNCC3
MMVSQISKASMNEVVEIVRKLASVLDHLEDKDGSLIAKMIIERLADPHCYVTVIGETSTGKSTLINGALGAPILPTAARPTTATVTLVCFVSSQQRKYTAIYKDEKDEKVKEVEITHEQFLQIGCQPSKSLIRLEIQAKPINEKHIGMYIFDTPGYNSLIAEHEEVLRDFLPESDIVVLVTGYRTGIGQADQDLLEVAYKALRDAELVPLVLVVNRTPPGKSRDDARIKEIFRNVIDCFEQEQIPELVIIESVLPKTEGLNESIAQQPVLPQVDQLWDLVHELATSPEQMQAVRKRLLSLAENLREQAEANVRRGLELIDMGRSGEDEIRSEIEALRNAEEKSIKVVSDTFKSLSSILPLELRRHCELLLKDLERDIDSTDKWLGKDSCVAWIKDHAMPFGVKHIARSIEEHLVTEMERLDHELEEIANTAIEGIQYRAAKLRSDEATRLAQSLAIRFTKRISGAALTSVLRSFGGACGPAAGAGNLSKMAVKRIAGVFGKRLSREVYNQIGRTFTKRALQRLNFIIAVVIEAVLVIIDANRWQKKLKESVQKAMEDWRIQTENELIKELLPEYQMQNEKAVHDIYNNEIKLMEESLLKQTGDREAEKTRLLTILNDLIRIGQSLSIMEDK